MHCKVEPQLSLMVACGYRSNPNRLRVPIRLENHFLATKPSLTEHFLSWSVYYHRSGIHSGVNQCTKCSMVVLPSYLCGRGGRDATTGSDPPRPTLGRDTAGECRPPLQHLHRTAAQPGKLLSLTLLLPHLLTCSYWVFARVLRLLSLLF